MRDVQGRYSERACLRQLLARTDGECVGSLVDAAAAAAEAMVGRRIAEGGWKRMARHTRESNNTWQSNNMRVVTGSAEPSGGAAERKVRERPSER